MFSEPARRAGTAGAGLLLATVWKVRLLALRGRQAGIVWGLRRHGQLGFEFADPRAQRRNPFGLRLDQRDQVIAGKRKESSVIHASP